MARMRLTIIVPAHNEEHRIGRMLDAYLPYFTRLYGTEVEFLVVINGTTDRTEEVVAAYQRDYPCLRTLVEPKSIGKGGALMMGFRVAQGQWVGFVDADGATPPESFQALMEGIGDAGGIIASRWCAGAQVSPRQPLDRRVASRIFNWITRLLFGLKLTDTQCGAKLLRRDAMLAVLPTLGITQWAFDVDLLFQLRRAGYAIREIPTTWQDIHGSKVKVVQASMEMVLALTRLRLMYSRFRWVVPLYQNTLGRILHPPGVERDHMVSHTLVLMIGAQVGNVSNLLFQLAMVRMLSGADYGVLAAMLGALMGICTPFSALSGTATHFAARFVKAGRPDQAVLFLRRMMEVLLVPVLLMLLVFVFERHAMIGYFQLEDPWPFYVAALIALTIPHGMVPGGILMGIQAFGWGTAISNGIGVLRLGLGIALVLAGFGAVGALAAHGLSGFAGLLAAIWVCRRLLRGRPVIPVATETGATGGVSMRQAWSYLAGYMVAFAGFAVLSNADLVLVKHFFDPATAGAFAKAALVARIVFFLPQPVASALFPKVVSEGDASYASGRTLIKAFVLTGGIVVAAGGFCLLFPGLMLRLLAGQADPAMIPVMRGMVLALAPLTMVAAMLSHEVAQRRFIVALPMGICAAGYVVAVEWWHETPMQVVTALGIASTVALVVVTAMLPWRAMREREARG